MHVADLLEPERIACRMQTSSKKRALEELSHLIVRDEPELNQTEVFERLIAREKLGSTGLGKGVAIPHGRLKSGDKTIAAFIQLESGIDYDAPDGQPVDLLCALLVPPESTEEHLQTLAALTEMFSQPALRDKLRSASSSQELYQILSECFGKS